ncbi:hypothetical protein A7K95_06825 [Pediococcus parvulus]|uniref:CAAX prenyl protease 2/Lysostaphin resistance protein A-like domain-containing protein n=1 Tax=Pediococcus parvulus TaxID=54062 RepID=A0ABX2UFS2_9LACO|nr:type II CAAX endopeptidase family protein [Pediococcus parvulus]OAD64062.1 hypothetical protein A7K95_06825 [Pediococcus parvulus]
MYFFKLASKFFYFLCFLVLFIIIQIPTLAESFWPNESVHDFSFIGHLILLLVSSAISFGLVFYLYQKVNGSAILKKPATFKNVGLAILLAGLSQVGQSFFSIWSDDSAANSDLTWVLRSSLSPILLVTLILVSPILEEILFQGILQGGILKGLSPIIQITLTAVVFAFMHGYSFSFGTLELVCSGIAYASVYYVTKDLKMAILCHSFSNIIVTILVFI